MIWLFVRMALYFVFAGLAGQGWGQWDPVDGIFSIRVDDLRPLIMGLVGFVGTFWGSRFAKRRGWST